MSRLVRVAGSGEWVRHTPAKATTYDSGVIFQDGHWRVQEEETQGSSADPGSTSCPDLLVLIEANWFGLPAADLTVAWEERVASGSSTSTSSGSSSLWHLAAAAVKPFLSIPRRRRFRRKLRLDQLNSTSAQQQQLDTSTSTRASSYYSAGSDVNWSSSSREGSRRASSRGDGSVGRNSDRGDGSTGASSRGEGSGGRSARSVTSLALLTQNRRDADLLLSRFADQKLAQEAAAAATDDSSGRASSDFPSSSYRPTPDEVPIPRSTSSRLRQQQQQAALAKLSRSASDLVDVLESSRHGSELDGGLRGAASDGVQGSAPEHGATHLGTWAHRVTRFAQSSDLPCQGRQEEEALARRISSTDDLLSGQAPQNPKGTPDPSSPLPVRRRSSQLGELGDEEAAWRWRFGRRWVQEQMNSTDPRYGRSGPGDDWDDALDYLGACGEGVRLQIAHTTSTECFLSSHSLISQPSEVSLLLAESASVAEGTLKEQVSMDATKKLAGTARKAQDLVQKQRQIEREVEERVRWDSTEAPASAYWAGFYLPAVQIDPFGRFPFVLLRTCNRAGRHKLLVRGKVGWSPPQLEHAANQEVAAMSAAKRLPYLPVEVLGWGICEWSRDRDRCLNCLEGKASPGASDASLKTGYDITRMAAALTRASLPMHYYVLVDGQRI